MTNNITKRFFKIAISSLLLSLSIAAAQQPALQEVNRTPSAKHELYSSDLLIGSGDLLEVNVLGAPEYRYEVRVTSAGEVTLPIAGAIKVGGLSVADAEKAIAQRLQHM